MKNPLVELQRLGQSPWHDNIRRSLLTSGKLAQMIAAGDITGLTSNPTIFEQAIAQSDDYGEALATLARAGEGAEAIVETLAIEDLKAAAELFHGVFERTRGADGYVSIEVSPKLARDTEATVAEAQRLWRAIARPNLMIKIPATREGLPAIERCIADGINVNVTLIFSLERYEAVMDAYVAGLRKRAGKNQDLGPVASVASFFVSRVDSLVDKILEEKVAAGGPSSLRELQGRAAIANAKLAYQAFLDKFSPSRFGDLVAKGARRQRPLWASTSTKNPKYPDVYYVEALVGPDTVDTMPPATIDAYRDHGNPRRRIDEDVAGARTALVNLAEVGVDMKQVLETLEVEGVASFAKSYDSLLSAVETRRAAVLGKR